MSHSDHSDDASRPLLVEERLDACLTALACLRHLALYAQAPMAPAFVADPDRFAKTATRIAANVARHVRVVKRALPVPSMTLAAPDVKGRLR